MKRKSEPNDLRINLTLTEAQGLHKTIGIAIDNLQTKMLRTSQQAVLEAAQADLTSLVSVQRQLLSLIVEAGEL